MNKTKIEWVQNPDGTQGFTWNPITGCLNHVNGLCKGGGFPCYAYKLANGRLRQRYLANANVADITQRLRDPNSSLWDKVATDPFYPRFWPERFWGLYNCSSELCKPRGIFVCDMSDLFGIGIPEEWTKAVLTDIKNNPRHRFYLLTKQPQNLIKFSPFPDNCWVGVTATNNTMLDKAMLGLADIVASKRFISFEPLLLPVKFSQEDAELVDWVIIGAQTRPAVYPKIEWVREIVDAADKADIPVFLKDNLLPLFRSIQHEKLGGVFEVFLDKTYLPNEFVIRQEMPNLTHQ